MHILTSAKVFKLSIKIYFQIFDAKKRKNDSSRELLEGERTNNGDFSPSDSIQSSEWGVVAFETQKARLFIGNDDKHTKHRNNSISLSKKSWRIILRCPNAKIGAGQNCLHIVLKNVTVLLKNHRNQINADSSILFLFRLGLFWRVFH